MKNLITIVKESENPYEGLPNVTTLGDGSYKGIILVHSFLYEGKQYFCETGPKNMFPVECEVIVENNEMRFGFLGGQQKQELLKLFE